MITLDRLKYFKEAAKYQHVGLAAKSLATSPSVISSAIKTLEIELDTKLFTRDKNRIKLNENGQKILLEANAIIDKVGNLNFVLNGEKAELSGHSKIGASPFLMREYLTSAFLKLQSKNLKIHADFSSIDTGLATQKVSSGLLDFALIFRSIDHSDIEEHILYRGNFQIAVRKNHPILRLNHTKQIQELNILPCASFKPNSGPHFNGTHPILKKYKVHPISKYRYDNNDISINILKDTQAWALLPDIVINSSKYLQAVHIHKEWKAPFKISFIKNKKNSSSRTFDALLEILLKKFQTHLK